MKVRVMAMALLLAGTTACSSSGKLEGTWLFRIDLNSEVEGDCAGDDTGGGTITYDGTNDMWVDIYRTGSGGLVVFLNAPLVGEYDGGELTASWQQTATYNDQTDTEKVQLTGSLDGGLMSGTIVATEESTGPDDTYTCTTRYTYDAFKNLSDPDDYASE